MAEQINLIEAIESDSLIFRSSNSCSIHPNNVVKQFCYQHDALLCNECNLKGHKKCDSVVSIEDASRCVRQSFALEDLKSRMNGLLENFDCDLDTCNKTKANLKEQKEQILYHIQEPRLKINFHLDKIENAMKEDLEKSYQLCHNRNEKHVQQIRLKRKDVQTWRDSLLFIESELDNKELFKVVKMLDKKTFSYESKVSETLYYTIVDYKISEDILTLKDQLKSFGEISISEKQETIQHLPKLQEGVKPLPLHVPNIDRKPVLRYSFRTSTWVCGRVSRGCLLLNDQLLLSNYTNPYVYITNLDGSDKQTIKLGYTPWDVDVIDNQKAIVTFGDAGYQLLNLETLSLGPRMKPGGSGAWSVSCSNGQILVGSSGNKIYHITVEGEIMQTYTTKQNVKFIYQGNGGNIYYNTVNDNAVFKLNGDSEVEEVFFTHPDLRDPTGIANDGQGNVYIEACVTDTIHKVHSSSKSHSIILSKGDGINGPIDIYYNKNTRQFLVVNDVGFTIDIYDM